MSENPYNSPTDLPTAPAPDAKIRRSAYCLLACSVLGIAFMALSAVGWIYLLNTRELTPSTRETGLWSLFYASIGVFVSVLVFVGAISMVRLRPRWLAILGACAALIPIFGPCFFLGIPFGIWALIVLFTPSVVSTFKNAASRHR
jgi:hypothetical protein